MTFDLDGPLLLVGAGNMGSALLAGWLDRGLDPAKLIVQDPSPPPATAERLAQARVRVAPSSADILAPAVIVLAVKPQLLDAVLPGLKRLASPATLVVSIAAGRRIESLARFFPPGTAIVRAMPNTPAAIGRGITVLCKNDRVTPAQAALCAALLEAVGEVAWIADEGLMDAVTAVSGSGPAYVFLLAECLTNAGKAAGLDGELAARLARATIAGAGELLHRSGVEAAELRRNVTSPGGTTAAALSVLMAPGGLNDLMEKAVIAATLRGRELGS